MLPKSRQFESAPRWLILAMMLPLLPENGISAAKLRHFPMPELDVLTAAPKLVNTESSRGLWL
jgi:hypothetical protein